MVFRTCQAAAPSHLSSSSSSSSSSTAAILQAISLWIVLYMSSLSPSSLGVREREKIGIVYYTFLPGSPADSPFFG
jgi:hypothetical protein